MSHYGPGFDFFGRPFNKRFDVSRPAKVSAVSDAEFNEILAEKFEIDSETAAEIDRMIQKDYPVIPHFLHS